MDSSLMFLYCIYARYKLLNGRSTFLTIPRHFGRKLGHELLCPLVLSLSDRNGIHLDGPLTARDGTMPLPSDELLAFSFCASFLCVG